MEKIPTSIQKFIDNVNVIAKGHPKWLKIFNKNFLDTLQNTVKILDDGTTFVLTGDIPAMWLRDSTAQIRPYLFLANESEEIDSLIRGLIERHFQMILIDPYANAFNETDNNKGHQTDKTDMQPIIWERKYEIDSLCYPIQLSYLYYKVTGKTNQFNETFHNGINAILDVWELEQDHSNSSYTFERETDIEQDTLKNNGRGTAVENTGMTWSGFRPSDDACEYHYLVPSNMFAVVVLSYLAEIYEEIFEDENKVNRINKLKTEIDNGIKEYAIVKNKGGKDVFAYEVDGLGNYKIMDDANVPSLLSAPYLGYCEYENPIYQETRKTILSEENPYYYTGKEAEGIGSPHTPENYVWHISLAMEGLTTDNIDEKKRMLNLMAATDDEQDKMHESFDVDDSSEYTRDWFSWPNMLFCELMLDYFGYTLKERIK